MCALVAAASERGRVYPQFSSSLSPFPPSLLLADRVFQNLANLFWHSLNALFVMITVS